MHSVKMTAKCPGNRAGSVTGNRDKVAEVHRASCDMLRSLLFRFLPGNENVANSSKRSEKSCNCGGTCKSAENSSLAIKL
jgi:hypothetical protein